MDPKGQKCNEDEWIAIRVEDPPSHQSDWRVGQQQAPSSAAARKIPGGDSPRGAALLADLKLMHPCDQVVIGRRVVPDQV